MGSSPQHGSATLSTPAQVTSFLNVCKNYQIKELDTARVYMSGKAEEILGETKERKDFILATKAPAFSPGSLQYDKIIDNCNKSLKALQLDKVDIYYLHGPDTQTPLEEQCRAIGKLHKEGKFDQFGISNLNEKAVTQIYEYCKKEGYVLPTVYQGGYNAVQRGNEKTLLPLLRQYGISFYSWGSLCGGALAKPIDDILSPAKGSRYEALPILGDMFLKDKIVAAIRKLTATCQENNLTILEASIRWIKFHSALGDDDAMILGASSDRQLENNLKLLENGPLTDTIVKAYEDMWENIKDVAPGYAF